MTTDSARRLVYLHSHPRFSNSGAHPTHTHSQLLTITLSSETGSGALPIAETLAAYLQADTPGSEPSWQVFGRQLMEKVLADHHLPTRMARFLREDASSAVDDVLDELFGLHPSSWMIAQKVADTILKLAGAGHAILVGWGAHVLTRDMPNVFQVRLVGSLERRLQRIEQRERLTRKQAMAFIHQQDRGRERYLKRYFGRQLGEPLLYHLTINTDRFSDREVTGLIAATALSRVQGQDLPPRFLGASTPANKELRHRPTGSPI